MRKLWIVLGVLAVLCIVTGLWWDTGGQHWAAYQTGIYCGSTGERYCYWSGFGSVMPWVLLSMGGILGFLAAQVRLANCHERGCWRIGRYPVVGGAFRFCGLHHPDWEGKHPSREHIVNRHQAHKASVSAAAPRPKTRVKAADQV